MEGLRPSLALLCSTYYLPGKTSFLYMTLFRTGVGCREAQQSLDTGGEKLGPGQLLVVTSDSSQVFRSSGKAVIDLPVS